MRNISAIVLGLLTFIALTVGANVEASAGPLEGTWKDEDGARTLVFTENTYQLTLRLVVEDGTLLSETVTTGTYRLGKADGELSPLDLTHEKTLHTAHADPQNFFIPQANKIKLCGYGDWKLGHAKNITGCERLLVAGEGQRLYHNIKIAGNEFQSTELTLTKGSIPEKRLTELLEWWHFKKVE